jgi:hypothetical protein
VQAQAALIAQKMCDDLKPLIVAKLIAEPVQTGRIALEAAIEFEDLG